MVEDETFQAPVRKRLEVFGIIYCQGSKEDKAKALYNIIQEEGQDRISISDKDFKKVFADACRLATLIVN